MKNLSISLRNLIAATAVISIHASTAVAQSDFVESGFLDDYARLQSDPYRPAVKMYIEPGVNFGEYDKVMIADIVLFLHPDSDYQGISARKMNEVTGEFAGYLRENLRTRREVVTDIAPGDKVIVFRAAISNVYAKRPERGVIGYTPIGLARTGVKKAAGSDYVLSTAAMELEAIDGQSGKSLGALVATELGETLAKARTGERKWSDIQAELREYANTLRDQFN